MRGRAGGLWARLGLAMAAALAPGPAAAIDLEKLVMPGPVVQGHAEIEADCARCHAPFQKESQNPLCLDCHVEVAQDLEASLGFHGRAPGVAQARCRDCHPEHQGRDADVIGLDRAAFDHRFTDYALHGAHARVACESCHPSGASFREAPLDCVGCHRDDDAHRGRLGEDCGRCHDEAAWTRTRFDHDATDFPLVGEHRSVACALCHPSERYENTTTDCNGCHRLNDAHLGRFGPECASCHSAHGWKPARFDHARDAGLALEGAHAGLACQACHTEGLVGHPLSRDCVSCHRADDVHRGLRGDGCDRCHGEVSWKTERFDHDRMTDFPLLGAHAEVRCEGCHTGALGSQKLATTCDGCHARDDVHAGQQGRSCGTCHNERGWADRVFFEHDVTRFPLLGMHATAACEQCHATRRFQDAGVDCVGCHAEEDVHLSRLGEDCARCHNPNGWKLWRFDHDQQTAFALRGAHANLDCHACHRAPLRAAVALLTTCGGCHASDDPHGGAYGHACERCHGETSWSEVEVTR
jgi:hypothetical protein